MKMNIATYNGRSLVPEEGLKELQYELKRIKCDTLELSEVKSEEQYMILQSANLCSTEELKTVVSEK